MPKNILTSSLKLKQPVSGGGNYSTNGRAMTKKSTSQADKRAFFLKSKRMITLNRSEFP